MDVVLLASMALYLAAADLKHLEFREKISVYFQTLNLRVKNPTLLKFTNFSVDIFSCFQLPVLVIGDKKFLFQISMN